MKRKSKTKIVCIYFVCISIFLCSCKGYTEIENMDILTSHFVYSDGVHVSLGGGIANVRSFSDSMADNPISYINASAPSLYEAAQKLQLSADHKLFYGGIRALIIGENYAKNGVGEFFDYIYSLPDHRASVDVFTSSTAAREIVEYKAINDFSGGFAAESIVATLQNDDSMISCTLSDIWQARLQEKVGFVIPDIEISDNVMSINGYSIFKNEKMVSALGTDSTNALNFLLSKNAKATYTLTLDDNTTCNISAIMTKKKIDVFEDETGVLNINAPFTFNLKVTTNKANELTMAQKEYIKNFMADKIKSEIMAVLYESKRLESDFLKLYSSYQTHSRSRFYELDWEKMIASMNIDASVFINKIQNDTVR